MKIGEAGLALIQSFEQCRLKAYPDPGSADGEPWTIAWGHTGGVKEGDTCTQEEADALQLLDLAIAESGVDSLVKVPITQNQRDALISFAYNVGLDMDTDQVAEGLGDSTLLRKLNAGDVAGAAAEFPKWNKNDGKVMNGLTRRRLAEQKLFLS